MKDIKENPDILFMKRALVLAQEAVAQNEVPVGAVAVLDGQIIAEGFNRTISLNDPTAHAEVVVLRAAACKLGNHRLLGVTLYVTLEPCVMCVGALIQARIRRLVFGAKDPRFGAVTSSLQLLDQAKFNHQIEYCDDILAGDCSVILKDFFKSRR